MFQPRSRDFSDPRVTAIVGHLQAIERELAAMGRKAGRQASVNAPVAGDLISDTIGPILNDMTRRFWRGQRIAAAGAADLGNQAVKVGSAAFDRIVGQAKERPLLTLAVAIGVGILIGAAGRRAT